MEPHVFEGLARALQALEPFKFWVLAGFVLVIVWWIRLIQRRKEEVNRKKARR